jgi:beta-glucuronidase
MRRHRALLALPLVLAACGGGSKVIVPVAPATVPLSGPWRFAVDPHHEGVRHGWFDPGFEDAGWARVIVPHTWNVLRAHRDYSGLAWYRRTFVLPERVQEAHLRLHFDAVFYAARVWLNGRELGRHEGGYTPFELDATTLARPGRNVLAVLVDNRRAADRIPADLGPGWSYDWWNYGGIVRDVSLAVTSKAYLAAQRIVAVPHLTGADRADSATVTVTIAVSNASPDALRGTVAASTAGARASAPISVAAGKTGRVRLLFGLGTPRLWHFDHPALYGLRTTLRRGSALLDERDETFGVRSVELAHGKLLLNGESVRLVGLSRHEDSPAHGLAETQAVVAADYRDLKTLNEVLARPVHYPQSPLVLDYADRHGILLIPEVPAWQLTRDQMASAHMQALERRQLRELVTSQANHPSMIAWSVGNELDSQTTEGWAFVKQMVRYVKSLDPTRPVGFASNHLYETPQLDATRFSDFVLMNEYFGSWGGPEGGLAAGLDRVHAAFPDKPVIVSEYGLEPHWYALAGESSVDYSRDREYYYVAESVSDASPLADSERRRLIADQLAVFRPRPWIVGASYWTYQDYRTPSGFVMGVVDKDRRRRRSWTTLRREYSPVQIESLRARPDGATVRLHTRADLPSYTLRGYLLRWTLRGGEHGSIRLPDLRPGSDWSGLLRWPRRSRRHVVTAEIVRPTGYSVTSATTRAG